jgi:5-methylcytosine-specific restriction endonuclease McrA
MDTLSPLADNGNPSEKRCTGLCNRLLPNTTEFFHRNGKYGLYPQCKECVSKKKKAHSSKTEVREHRKTYSKAYRLEHQDYVRSHKKAYYAQPEVQTYKRIYTRTYRTRPGVLEKKHVQAKEYNDRPETQERRRPYDRTLQHNRRARIKGNGGSHTVQDIQEQLKRQKHKCYYCSAKFKMKDNNYIYHIDHVIPVAKGGSNDMSNIVLACPKCNQTKNDRLPHEWAEGGRLL